MTKDLKKEIDRLASQCVKCGLCLPHCPTYEISQDENESPRGRISLMQGLVQNKLSPSEHVADHLNRCLSCRNCETVCPAHVQYGELIDDSRAWLHQHHAPLVEPSFKTRLLQHIVSSPWKLKVMGRSLRLLQITGIRRVAQWMGLPYLFGLARLNKLLPPVPSQKAWPSSVASQSSPALGQVALFLGCLSQWTDRQTQEATLYALNTCGYDVIIPRQQGCCGAMAHHQGNFSQAHPLIKRNADVFENHAIEAILSTASGCASMLKDSKLYYKEKNIESMSNKVTDISEFIKNKIPKNKLKPLNFKVALHTPCTLKNGLHQAQGPQEILAQIPNLDWFNLSTKQTCCGSAGAYMIEEPQWSDTLVNNLLSQIDDHEIDFIVTSNIGCALHVRKALIAEGKSIKVVHPMVLLAKSLGWKP